MRGRIAGTPSESSRARICLTAIRKTGRAGRLSLLPVGEGQDEGEAYNASRQRKGRSLQTAQISSGLAPTAAHENMAPATKFVVVGSPARARPRRMIPTPTVPTPAATLPNPAAADPNNTRSWHRGLHLHERGRRRGIDVNLAHRGCHSDLHGRRTGLHHASSHQQAGAGKNQY